MQPYRDLFYSRSPMPDALPPAADRFAYFMECLCRALGDPRFGPLTAGPLTLAIWKRLRRIATRFAVLAALIRSGALPASKPRRAPSPHREHPAASSRSSVIASAIIASEAKQSSGAIPNQTPRLPNRFGWLTRLRPGLHCFGGLLRHLLNDQEFQTLLTASPEIRKLIRSLCRMFGLPLIPLLREPRRPGARSLEPASSESVNRTPQQRGVPRPNPASQLLPSQLLQNLPRLHLPPGYDPLVPIPRRKKPA